MTRKLHSCNSKLQYKKFHVLLNSESYFLILPEMSGEAIPMGAITAEPKSTSSATAVELSDVNLENGNGSGTVTEQTLTGLGPLRDARRLVIKQRIRLCDIVSLCTGCEVSNPESGIPDLPQHPT